MMQYIRSKIPGATYFFTIVTFNRSQIFREPQNISILKDAFNNTKRNYPFSIDTIVILPDHIHFIMTLPEGDSDYPLRLRLIKTFFSKHYKKCSTQNSPSRMRKNEKSIWQRRYWEHVIRDDEDFRRHVEYIHYNPVKHGLVDAPKCWQHSSFHSYVRDGKYATDWGADGNIVIAKGVGAE